MNDNEFPINKWMVILVIMIAIVLLAAAVSYGDAGPSWLLAAAIRGARNLTPRRWKPIEFFAARKGFSVTETNKIYRLYDNRTPVLGEPVRIHKTYMNELAVADFLMFEPDVKEYTRDRTIPEPRVVDLVGLSPEERDAVLLGMMKQ